MKLISHHAVISVLVKDQDEAIRFYTDILGLEMRGDTTFGSRPPFSHSGAGGAAQADAGSCKT